jgi:hypothetical protein
MFEQGALGYTSLAKGALCYLYRAFRAMYLMPEGIKPTAYNCPAQ